MWTPRRLLLLLLGLAFFGTAYAVYARFLGGIDGLPLLPEEYLVRRTIDSKEVIVPATQNEIDRKLIQAFGPASAEVNWPNKLNLGRMGLILAFVTMTAEDDGRMRLTPCSLAIFKEAAPGGFPEVSTIHSDVGLLSFDRPVTAKTTFLDLGTRRITGCELIGDKQAPNNDERRGRVIFTNNRGSANPAEGLSLVTPGPVTYQETSGPDLPLDQAKPQVWTHTAVQIIDRHGRPEATTIDAVGMSVFLAAEPPPAHGAPPPKNKPRTAAVSGVRRIVLDNTVRMDLWMEPNSGFMSGPVKPAAPAPAANVPAAPPEPTHLVINTLGRFYYDVLPDADRARFDCQPRNSGGLTDRVHVERPQVKGGGQFTDQLECDHLEMQFAHKPVTEPAKPGAPKPPAKPAGAVDPGGVEWIHAWGPYLILTSDDQRLNAQGDDLFHDARVKHTVLKGTPEMLAVQEGNEIRVPELVLYAVDSKEGQQALGRGPGTIRMPDKDPKHARFARWREQLVFVKQDGHDLLTLIGGASFEDPANDQTIQGDQIKLLLAAPPAGAPTPVGGERPAPRPQRLEVTGRVVARSPSLTVHDTRQMVVLFKDVAALPVGTPAPSPPVATGGLPAPSPPVATGGLPVAIPNTPTTQPTSEPPSRPIDLAAESVQAFVLRVGEQNALEKVDCEGGVRVHQDPATPQEKPIDMRGQTLQLTRYAAGNVLVVTDTESSARPAEVHFPDLSLIGPRITIDQVENVAEVQGPGSMLLVTQTDISGNKLTKPTPLEVHWKQSMHFQGKVAEFHGNVQADQEHTRLLCSNMAVHLDRPVSLNQPGQFSGGGRAAAKQPGEAPASVDTVICDGTVVGPPVTVEEATPDEKDRNRLARYQRIESRELFVHREDGDVNAPGPGVVRIFQLGPKDEGGAGPGAPLPKSPAAGGARSPAKPPPEEFKLTIIAFGDRMRLKDSTRSAWFYGDVEVIHLPTEDWNLRPDPKRLPAGTLHLRCGKLTVYSGSKDAAGRIAQQMEARVKASVEVDGHLGYAEVIKFDERDQKVIFEGTDDNLAHLYKISKVGDKADDIKARWIEYNRVTGTYKVDNARNINIGP